MHIPTSPSHHRLAVTGMAIVNALGNSVAEVWSNSLAMRSGICPLQTRFDDPPNFVNAEHFIPGTNTYCGVIGHANLVCTRQDVDLPPQDFRAMSTSTRMTLLMAKQAIDAAGLPQAGYDPQRVGVFISQNSGEAASTLWDLNLSVRARWVSGLAAEVGKWSAEQQEDFYQRLTQGRVTPDESSMLCRLNCTAAGTIAQRYGFAGPSFSVGAACSSSMAALYSACTLIRAGVIDAAVVGGGEEGYAPLYFAEFSALGALARPSEHICKPEDYSRPFDLHRTGFVLGEGAGMVVLEREDYARKRSAPLHGLITSIAAGTNTVGLIEPSAHAQAQAIRQSFAALDYGPESVDLVECHATATPQGDLAEAQSLVECFGHKQQPTVLSGYKGQIGHTTGASGIISLIHGLSAMREGLFPGTLNCSTPDPALQLDSARLRVLSTPEPWEKPASGIRRMQVNTFGFGGSCFVAQVEEPNDRRMPATTGGNTMPESTLFQGQESLVDGTRMVSLAHQGQLWRLGATAPAWKAEIAGLSVDPSPAELTALSRRGLWLSPPVSPPPVAIMCCGQGSVWPGMGRALYDTFPAAREAMDRIAKVAEWDILALMDEPSLDTIILTRWQQPYLFLLEYAQAHYLSTLGLKPAVMAGHSLGELIALCLAGVYTPETAWSILDTRSRFMAQLEEDATSETGMMSVHCTTEVLEATLKEWPELHVSNYNSPMQVILSGSRPLLQEVRKILRKRRVPAMLLNVSLAFHHPHMRALREASLARLQKLEFHAPTLPMMSNITTGLYPDTKDAIVGYIADLDENSVRWVECVRAMWNTYGIRHFVEMGPGDTLCGLVSDIESQAVCVAAGRKDKEVEAMRTAVARLYALGHLPMRAGQGAPQPAASSATAAKVTSPATKATNTAAPCEEHIEKVMPIIAQATGYTREELHADMDLRHDLAIRSSRFPLIMHEAERQFQIKLRFEDMLGVATIRDLADVLRKLQSQNADVQPAAPAAFAARPQEDSTPLPVIRYAPTLCSVPACSTPAPVEAAHIVLVGCPEHTAPYATSLAALYPAALLRHCATAAEARQLFDDASLPDRRGLVLVLAPANTSAHSSAVTVEPADKAHACTTRLHDAFALVKDFCAHKGAQFCLAVQADAQDKALTEDPFMAGLAGLFLAAALEYPACLFRTVCLGATAPEHWLSQILTPASLQLQGGEEHRPVQWILTDGTFRTLQLQGQALDPALPLTEEACRPQALPVRQGDIIMVPGGARGITPYALTALAPQACTFVLLGRTATPPAAGSAEHAALARLTALGSRVEHLACDVTDDDALRATVQDIVQRLGRIDGCIFAAGITRDATLDALDSAAFDAVVQVKCHGLWHSLEACRPAGLRYAVAFSSMAAWLGNYGQANYCAANRCMSALLHSYAREHGIATRALWLPPVLGAGMAAGTDMQEQMRLRGMENTCLHCDTLGDLLAHELFCGTHSDILWARALPAVPHVSPPAPLSYRAQVGQCERAENFPLVFPIRADLPPDITDEADLPYTRSADFVGSHHFSWYADQWYTDKSAAAQPGTAPTAILLECLVETATQHFPWLTATRVRNFALSGRLSSRKGITREARITSHALPWEAKSASMTRICDTTMQAYAISANGRKQRTVDLVCKGEIVLETQVKMPAALWEISADPAYAAAGCFCETVYPAPVEIQYLFPARLFEESLRAVKRACVREGKNEYTLISIDEIVFYSQNGASHQGIQISLRMTEGSTQTALHFDGQITDTQGAVCLILRNIVFAQHNT